MRMRRCLLMLGLCSSSALADHPLITEDTGVIGKGAKQIEVHGEKARDRAAGATTRTTDVSVVLSYGVTERADLQLELPYVREVIDGEVLKGRGDASLAVKWRFFDKEPLSMVLKPELVSGGRWALNYAVAYDFGRLEGIVHAGYTHNLNRIGERKALWHRSVALLWSAAERWRLVLDLGLDSSPDPVARTHERQLAFGVSYALTDDVVLGVGAKKGLNEEADDRALLAGVKVRW